MAIKCSGKKCFAISLTLFVVAAVALWAIWFGAWSLLGKREVENGLQQLSEQLVDAGNEFGKNIKFSYGKIDIEGWGNDRREIIHDINIDVEDKVKENVIKFTVNIDNIVASSDPVDFRKLMIQITKPINISLNGEHINSVIFSEPLTYYYLQTEEGVVQSFQHEVVFPKTVTVLGKGGENIADGDKENKVSEEQAVDGETSINFAEHSFVRITAVPEQNTNSFEYDITGLRISKKDQNILTIGSLKSSLNEELGDVEGRIVGKYILSASDIALYSGEKSTKPYSISVNTDISTNADIHAVGQDVSVANDVSVPPSSTVDDKDPSEDREVVLNNATLSNPDFKLHATGKFANVKGDSLPSGEVNVDIDNLPKFLDSEIVAMQNRKMIEVVLEKITGQPLYSQESASILLKREKNGVFHVGKTTFEELVASALSGAIMPTPPSGGGRLPEIESSTKIPVIEPSVSLPNKGNNADAVELPVTIQKP